MILRRTLALIALAASLPAFGQILPKGFDTPVEVVKPKGEFAMKLNGASMPSGKGWKAAVDSERLFQLMVPDKWKVEPDPDGEAALIATPPGHEKDQKAALVVVLRTPSDRDPLVMDEEFASNYAEAVVEDDPALKQLKYNSTDSGFVLARGYKFALAGGTFLDPEKRKETYQQQQLLYISEDRIVSIQFSAPAKEFAQYADALARIFASYQDLGMRKEPAEN